MFLNRHYFKRDVSIVNGVLKRAVFLLETKGWTRGIGARTKNGRGVQPDSKKAARFCVTGALAGSTNSSKLYWGAVDRLDKLLVKEHYAACTIIVYNDSIAKNKNDVINLLRKALKYES